MQETVDKLNELAEKQEELSKKQKIKNQITRKTLRNRKI